MFTFLVWPLLSAPSQAKSCNGKNKRWEKNKKCGPLQKLLSTFSGEYFCQCKHWAGLCWLIWSHSVRTPHDLARWHASCHFCRCSHSLCQSLLPWQSLLCHLSTEKLTPNTLIHSSSWQAWKSTQRRLVFTTNSQECSRELPALLSNSLLFEKS